jgi:CRP-like cAMP-binding protein
MTQSRAPSRIIPRAFPGIKPNEIEDLIANSQVHTYSPGSVLCRENAIEDRFYMILEGEVEVSKSINNQEARLLKTLGPGDFFGEMALIHNAPRAATVTAKSALTALELDKTSFNRVLHNSTSVALAMVSEISNRLRSNDELAVDDLRMRASELAEAYQRLAEQELARREFLTNIAHELRTPLMVANGYLQMLQRGLMNGDQLTAGIETVARNVQQIASLVNDILFLQEMELVLPEFQAVDMNGIANQVVDNYLEKANERGISCASFQTQACLRFQATQNPSSARSCLLWTTPSSSARKAVTWKSALAQTTIPYSSQLKTTASGSKRKISRVSSTVSIISNGAATISSAASGWGWQSRAR